MYVCMCDGGQGRGGGKDPFSPPPVGRRPQTMICSADRRPAAHPPTFYPRLRKLQCEGYFKSIYKYMHLYLRESVPPSPPPPFPLQVDPGYGPGGRGEGRRESWVLDIGSSTTRRHRPRPAKRFLSLYVLLPSQRQRDWRRKGNGRRNSNKKTEENSYWCLSSSNLHPAGRAHSKNTTKTQYTDSAS